MEGPGVPELSHQSLKELAASLTEDPSLQPHVAALMASRVENALERYFSEPARFRKALGDARAILSGSWVLRFIMEHSSTDAPTWTENDLDVYCPEEGVVIVVATLLDEGYYPSQAQVRDPPSRTSTSKLISRVLRFNHETRGKKIDVVCTHASTPFEVVLDFWTTLVMNAITVHDITILYPDLTLAKQGRQPTERLKTRGVGHLLCKYIARGFNIWPFTRQRPTAYRPDDDRNSRDKRCLSLPIAVPEGYARGPRGSSLAMWSMGGYEGEEGSHPFTATTKGADEHEREE
ncbi:hypothetical protein K488DRAFT_73395 [Vararia minispora EC-137]|uniref:Uncharacterized protein n=1 Tax=Vararia minispora EC-137 TaxID=1314806 RepID=A0ACB8QAY6_9AGAM|nr:hypothetical protein K488DRAFT_73395 [Vararia minispora EC-137]